MTVMELFGSIISFILSIIACTYVECWRNELRRKKAMEKGEETFLDAYLNLRSTKTGRRCAMIYNAKEGKELPFDIEDYYFIY